MRKIAIIGGTGLTSITDLNIVEELSVDTPYGAVSAPVIRGEIESKKVYFLARHGVDHNIPPHKINYRANIWALKSVGITDIIGVGAVGGINKSIPPKKMVIPDQIIDYTYGRKHTFYEDDLVGVTHIDFTNPYHDELRQRLLHTANELSISVYEGGTYGATQGPRLETAAEIDRMENDGCDIVGMTGMPEAVLAKELGLHYACCALCVNWAAGREDEEIDMQKIKKSIEEGMISVKQLLSAVVSRM